MRNERWTTRRLALLALMGLGCGGETQPVTDQAANGTMTNNAVGPDQAAIGVMSEESGCRILNKGKRGQICYYDVTRHRPEREVSGGPDNDVPIRVSARKHETVLWHKGDDLTGKPILERRSVLERILKPAAGIQLGSYVETEGEALFELTRQKGIEGIIAKRKDSTRIMTVRTCCSFSITIIPHFK